jgi:hypothetical protein
MSLSPLQNIATDPRYSVPSHITDVPFVMVEIIFSIVLRSLIGGSLISSR